MQDFVFTRRELLKGASLVGLGLTLPSFLTQSALAAPLPGFKDDHILVVIQLGGGNDGLNTVVPHGDDNYGRLRKSLALGKDKVLPLADGIGLNPGLASLRQVYDRGELSIIQGVGYPNPDRSHFRSMEILHTATDSDRFSRTGWIGRYFDNCCEGKPAPHVAVNIGAEAPQAFDSRNGAGVSFQDPAQFRWREGRGADTRGAFDRLNHTAGSHDEHGTTVDFLRHTTANAVISSDRVIRASSTKRQMPQYPQSRLAGQLRTIATLIAGGLPTRIFYTAISGFDTHANQTGQHENLLRQFSDATSAFWNDLKAIGVQDRVTVLVFSEFGRRVEENASRGTDHGTAGPMFVLGKRTNPGLLGRHPSLTDLDEGDLKHTVDFRSVYGELLTGWMGGDPAKVLGKDFPAVGLMKA